MRTLFVAAITFAVMLTPAIAADDAELYGPARVVDGNGVEIGGVAVHFKGIAAPEDNGAKREPGGPESTANLRALAEGKNVRCALDGTKVRERLAAVCHLRNIGTFGGTIELGLYQVETGHARDCPRFSRGRYADAELRSRARRDLSATFPIPDYCMLPAPTH